MKKRLLQLFMVAAMVGSAPAWAEQNVTVLVKGMVCDFCVQGLTKGFNVFKDKAVLNAFKIDLTKHTINLTVKEGAKITDDEITTVVNSSSMAVDKIVR